MDQLKQSLSTILTLCRVFGYTGSSNLEGTARTWHKFVEKSKIRWDKLLKYKLAAFYASHKGTRLPVPPPGLESDKPHVLVGGELGRWMRSLLHNASEARREEFLQSILQSKKGMPRADASQLKEAAEATVKKLTTEPEKKALPLQTAQDWADVEEDELPHPGVEQVISRAAWIRQIRRRVHELFKGQYYTHEHRTQAFFPSTSANYINTRSRLGAVGSLLESNALDGLRVGGGWLEVEKEGESLFEQVARAQAPPEPLVEGEEEEKGKEPLDELLDGAVNVDDETFNKKFELLWLRVLDLATKELNAVRAVPLAEALKIRVITAGPPMRQTVLRSLWKFCHSVLRKHPAFALIGDVLTEEYMLNRLGRELAPGEVYLSGDYEAATDNIESWASEAVADAIADEIGLYPVERRLFREALTGHVFDGETQKRGQLMGSIVSFVVLCILNGVGTVWAAEVDDNRLWTLRDARAMFNGDDVALRCKMSTYKIWSRITSYIGLKESIGKTYVSAEFVNINSRSFLRTKEPFDITCKRTDGSTVTRQSHLKEVQFVNMGLLLGLKRSQGGIGLGDQDSPYSNIAARAWNLHNSCPPDLRSTVMRAFLKQHRELLTKTRLPWYLPTWIGGVGLPPGEWGQPTDLDLRLARRVLLNWKRKRPLDLGGKEAKWRTWATAVESLPPPVYLTEQCAETEFYKRVVGKKCVDLLFDAQMNQKRFMLLETDNTKVSRALSRNADLYRPSGGLLPPPLSATDLAFRQRYPAYLSPSSFERLNELLPLLPRRDPSADQPEEAKELTIPVPAQDGLEA